MSTKIYVGNLPYTTDDAQLRELFGAEGREVTEVAIITDRMTGQPRGFAFVQMSSYDDARKAIDELHGSSFGGRTLTVNEARPRDGGGASHAGPSVSATAAHGGVLRDAREGGGAERSARGGRA